MNRTIAPVITIMCCLGCFSANVRAQETVDLLRMKNDIQIFEAILDQALDQVFSNPFSLVERTKGVYLANFGTTFAFLVNIKTATMETPFGTIKRSSVSDPKLRQKKLAELQRRVIEILATYGNGIHQLKESDSVVIVAHIVDQNFRKKRQNKTIIVSALKKDLRAHAGNQISAEVFRKRVNIVEY